MFCRFIVLDFTKSCAFSRCTLGRALLVVYIAMHHIEFIFIIYWDTFIFFAILGHLNSRNARFYYDTDSYCDYFMHRAPSLWWVSLWGQDVR